MGFMNEQRGYDEFASVSKNAYICTKLVHKNFKNMLIISSREFRANQKKYFDLADNDEKIIVHRGKDKAYLLSPIKDVDVYFSEPEIIKKMQKAIDEVRQGETVTVEKGDIKKLLNL